MPPALAVILRAKYLQTRTASTKEPPPPPQKGYRRLVLMVTPPLWSVGRLWHGSSTDCLPCLNCDGSKQAKTDCGRVDGASAE